jgi:hypothetical protein
MIDIENESAVSVVPTVKAKQALAKLSQAISAIDSARGAVDDLRVMRESVASLRKIASDPAASDEAANAAAGQMVGKCEELRIAELSADRRQANLDRALAAAVNLCRDELLPVMESEAFHLERDATASGFAVLRSLLSPAFSGTSPDEPQGALCERAVGQTCFHLAGVYESTMLLQETESAGKVDAVAMPNVVRELLQSWEARTGAIRAAIARLSAMVPAV